MIDKRLPTLRKLLHLEKDSSGTSTISMFRSALNFYVNGVEQIKTNKIRGKTILQLCEDSHINEFYLLMMFRLGKEFGTYQLATPKIIKDEAIIHKLIEEIDGLFNKLLSNKIKKEKTPLLQILTAGCAEDIATYQKLVEHDVDDAHLKEEVKAVLESSDDEQMTIAINEETLRRLIRQINIEEDYKKTHPE
jgi:hypothetical protein